jgi:hypothetical protein
MQPGVDEDFAGSRTILVRAPTAETSKLPK